MRPCGLCILYPPLKCDEVRVSHNTAKFVDMFSESISQGKGDNHALKNYGRRTQ